MARERANSDLPVQVGPAMMVSAECSMFFILSWRKMDVKNYGIRKNKSQGRRPRIFYCFILTLCILYKGVYLDIRQVYS